MMMRRRFPSPRHAIAFNLGFFLIFFYLGSFDSGFFLGVRLIFFFGVSLIWNGLVACFLPFLRQFFCLWLLWDWFVLCCQN